ncbi:MAG: hypothetical protein RI947_806 [Candidatus Parcubacteria bacterium]|jgi:hypothetical protein
MLPTDVTAWTLQIVTFVYFSCKDFVLARLFKDKSLKVHPVFSLIMAFIGLYVNAKLQESYVQYLDMSYIKGSIQLPPFPLLFIAADFASSVALILILYVRVGVSFFSIPFARHFVNVMRFIFIYVVFTSIVSTLWVHQLEKQINWDYTCFRNQLAIDAAVYYYRNGHMPESLSEFTTITTNPANRSPLQFSRGQGVNITVTDKAGNQLVNGYKDFIGIKIYTDNPADFFVTRRITNDTLCHGTLKIPPEYDIEPSWKR